MLEVRHARQNGHRLALRTGRHVNELVVGNICGVLRINQHAVWNVEVTHLLSNLHVANHASTNQCHLAIVCNRSIDNLLHAMNVTRERCNDYAALRTRDNVFDNRANVFFERGETRNIGVGRVAHKQVEAGFANTCEGAKVG